MKGWVGLVGWPIADGLPTIVVTHQLQVKRRTGKVRRPETDVLPLCHAGWSRAKGHWTYVCVCTCITCAIISPVWRRAAAAGWDVVTVVTWGKSWCQRAVTSTECNQRSSPDAPLHVTTDKRYHTWLNDVINLNSHFTQYTVQKQADRNIGTYNWAYAKVMLSSVMQWDIPTTLDLTMVRGNFFDGHLLSHCDLQSV